MNKDSIKASIILVLNMFIAVALITAMPAYFNNRVFLDKSQTIKEAMFYHTVCNGVQCDLCPKECFLPEGYRGKCRVRINTGDKLFTMVYGLPKSVAIDPIEKKPVYHLKPGSTAFSIATNGCNLRCDFCQNWQLSQCNPEDSGYETMLPEKVVEQARLNNCQSIAYTYSEPVIFYEYVYDTARLAKEKGIYNVFISGGYINREPLEKLLPYLDVVKIDLKGFDDGFYRRTVGCKLSDVLSTLRTLKANNKLTEVVNLVVPGLNDNMGEIRQMSRWIKENMGADTPLFFTRFYPQYLLSNLPATDESTLVKAHDIAKEEGLQYVYVGNLPGNVYESTYCPHCGRIVIKRYGYTILENHIKDGKCGYCGYAIRGIW